ncbi:unnamed protein product, partial [Rangifer tarandus platyrhynchus]
PCCLLILLNMALYHIHTSSYLVHDSSRLAGLHSGQYGSSEITLDVCMNSLPRIVVKHPTSPMPGELIQKTTAESLCKAASQHYCPCLLSNWKVPSLFTFNLEAQTSLSFTTQ